MSDTPVIDPQTIASLRALNPEDGGQFLREVTEIFASDTPQRIADLESSLAAGDIAKFTRTAHTIKGSSANLGANLLRAAAEKLEQMARETGLNGVAPLIAEIKAEFTRAQAELVRLSQ